MQPTRKVWPLFLPEALTPWRPLANVYRTRDGWLLKFDLAGVRLPDVTVSVCGRFVKVSGVRKDTTIEQGATYYSMEISYNRFERTIEMPADLEDSKLTIEARDGILLVRLQSSQEKEEKHAR